MDLHDNIELCQNDIIKICREYGAEFDECWLCSKISQIMLSGLYSLRDLAMVVYGALQWTGGATDLCITIEGTASVNQFYEKWEHK